jgi:ABC-type multidrug transport system ATPase subunit
MAAEDAIVVEGLEKSYGSVRALCGVDFRARTGSVLGLLGPNGAGKTTAVRILTTLLKPDGGTARVAGVDVVREAATLRARIGLAGQYAAVDENLTGFENLEMVGQLYHLPRAEARKRGRRAARPPRPPGGRSRRTPAACAAGSISPRRWWPARPCCSSTSPRPGSTRAAA